MYKLTIKALYNLFILGYNSRTEGSKSFEQLEEIFNKWVRTNLENRND